MWLKYAWPKYFGTSENDKNWKQKFWLIIEEANSDITLSHIWRNPDRMIAYFCPSEESQAKNIIKQPTFFFKFQIDLR